MTSQTPLDSGFDLRSTPSDVLAGQDLSGTFVVLTGGYSGLGLETARALATAGADVVVPARRPQHAAEMLAALGDTRGSVTVEAMDLSDLDSVRACAQRLVEQGRSIDIAINNAAIMACPESRNEQGWESQFATNHLGHYVLINELWPLLAADGGARVVALSSTGHKLSPMRWDDIDFETGYEKWPAYGQAKTANSLFAVQLDVLGASAGVRAFAVHPGGIMTELQRHLPQEEMIAMGWVDADGNINELFKSPEQGAATSVWAATSPLLEGKGGLYCEDCDVAKLTLEGDPMARFMGVSSHGIDPEDAAKLWALSAERTGANAFAS